MFIPHIFFPSIISLAAIVFWAWMFWDFINNPKISPDERLFWFVGFVVLSILTAGFYYFTQYEKKR